MKVASLLFLITFFISCNISNVNKDEIVAEVNGEKNLSFRIVISE